MSRFKIKNSKLVILFKLIHAHGANYYAIHFKEAFKFQTFCSNYKHCYICHGPKIRHFIIQIIHLLSSKLVYHFFQLNKFVQMPQESSNLQCQFEYVILQNSKTFNTRIPRLLVQAMVISSNIQANTTYAMS